MAHRYGADMEERSAIARKAQDSYAISRQAMERIKALEDTVRLLREELEAAHEKLMLTVERLQRQFDAATEPVGRVR